MFDIPSLKIGKLFGIPIEVNLSWIVIFGLISYSLGAQWFPKVPQSAGAPQWEFYLLGAITALLFFFSIVLHELSHSLVARAEGGHVDKITLFIFGGVAQIDDEPTTAGREFLMAAAGPGMSIVIALAALIAFAVTSSAGLPWWVWSPLQYLAAINFFVGVFNLLPGFPMDGGRVLRSILWGLSRDLLSATRWAVRVGQFIGWSLVVLAVVTALNGNLSFVWLGLIGWFITTLAGQAYRQQVLRSRTSAVAVGEIMSRDPESIDASESLEDAIGEHFLGKGHSRYPVVQDGSVVGLITLPDVKTVSRSEWHSTRVGDVANKDLGGLVVAADTPVDKVLQRLSSDKPGALLVVGDGHLVGIVTRADVIGLLQGGAAA
jgi:Zn-dependent protease/predicted transcriptional regulator